MNDAVTNPQKLMVKSVASMRLSVPSVSVVSVRVSPAREGKGMPEASRAFTTGINTPVNTRSTALQQPMLDLA